jgi:hypothetical protein
VLVVLFSWVGESIKPRRLAGIASAAPSIALASLGAWIGVSLALYGFTMVLVPPSRGRRRGLADIDI